MREEGVGRTSRICASSANMCDTAAVFTQAVSRLSPLSTHNSDPSCSLASQPLHFSSDSSSRPSLLLLFFVFSFLSSSRCHIETAITVLASPLQAAQLLSTPLPLDYRIIHHTSSRLYSPAHLPSLGHERAWSAIVLKCLSLGMITLCAPCAPVSSLYRVCLVHLPTS